MTQKAKSINALVETLSLLAVNGTAIKLGINCPKTPEQKQEFNDLLIHYQNALKAHLANIVEGNEEQAEALMADLGVRWKK